MTGDGIVNPSNTPQEQGAALPASEASVQQVSVTPSDATQGAGVGTQTEAHDEQLRKLQSIADQRLAESYRLQQELQRVQQQVALIDQRTTQEARNPFDPNTQGMEYWKWENKQLAMQAAAETRRQLAEEFQNYARMSQEQSWQQSHPDVDINAVKMFMQQRGISNPDDAYTLMTLGNRMQSVASNASQTTFNNIVKPTNGAQPIRSGGAPQQPVYEIRALLEAYNKNPNIEKTWDEGTKKEFWTFVNNVQAG